MIKEFCDKCGKEVPDTRYFSHITMAFQGVDTKKIALCLGCWLNAIRILGYTMESGVLLSIARGSQVNHIDIQPEEPDAGAMLEYKEETGF